MKWRNVMHGIQLHWRRGLHASGYLVLACIWTGSFLFGWRFWDGGPSIALHYSVLLGVDTIGPWWYILLLPFVGTIAWFGVFLLKKSISKHEIMHDIVLLTAWATSILLILDMLFAFVASAS